MGSCRRKRKICRKLEDPQSKDRISSLPDEVLGQILSFLPSKYAVATSILSSRWRNLYELSTSLDFDDSVSFKPRKGMKTVKGNTHFRKFVDGVLSHCKESHIKKFRLKCGLNFDHSQINDWINAAFFHKITEFELSIDTSLPHKLQLPLMTCENLVVLKLDCSLVLDVPDIVTMPSLKLLFLREIKFSNYGRLNGILSRCPFLEELVMDGCDWNGGNLYISNPCLRRLTVDVGMTGPLDQFNGCLVYFDAPSLIFLKYNECLAEHYLMRNLNSLVEAHIEISFNDDEFDEAQDICDAILDLLIGVHNSKCLYLSGQCLEALTSGEFELPVFRYLTRLELGRGFDVTWDDVVHDFLTCSPCLEVLVFVQGFVEWDAEDKLGDNIFLNDEVPLCVKSHLKVVEVKDYRGLKQEMYIVMYFLEHAQVLEELLIYWRQANRAKDFLSKEKEILNLPKASKTCSVVFR